MAGFVLLVLSSSDGGTYDAGQAAIYRSFVQDLHARLAALKDAEITYTAGYSNARQKFGLVLLVVVVLFFLVLPTVLLLMTRELSLFSSLYFGVFLAWPLHRLILTNEPSTYDPRALPDELIDTGDLASAEFLRGCGQDLVRQRRVADGARQDHGPTSPAIVASALRRRAAAEPGIELRQDPDEPTQRRCECAANRLGLARRLRGERRHRASAARRVAVAARQIRAHDRADADRRLLRDEPSA